SSSVWPRPDSARAAHSSNRATVEVDAPCSAPARARRRPGRDGPGRGPADARSAVAAPHPDGGAADSHVPPDRLPEAVARRDHPPADRRPPRLRRRDGVAARARLARGHAAAGLHALEYGAKLPAKPIMITFD